MLKGVGEISFKVTDSYNNENDGLFIVGKDNTKTIKITNKTKLDASITTNDYQSFWNSLNAKVLNSKGTVITTSLSQMTSDATKKTITLNNIDANPFATILLVSTTAETKKFLKTELGQYDLKLLEQIRDVILHKKGNETISLNGTNLDAPNGGSTELRSMFNDLTLAQANKLGGMLLKTYDSDIFNNWIKTDWLDGEGGINEITAIDTSSGSFTMDTLNLAKKVYDMLNRIAVSGGTYQDWIQTVYTNEYIERSETPVYQGGYSDEVVFQEVVSNSATENEPLGTLAGRGKLQGNNKGGNITVKLDESSYIIGLVSLTPRVDYSQGNRWDTDLKTLDDLHKPALDGIGFQDLTTNKMAWC